MGNPVQIDYDTYIDLKEPGRSANHSCNPNSGIVKNSILIAIEDIFAGEEICYDYSTTMMENYWTMVCKCGSKDCRGVIKDFHLLPETVKKRYLKLGIVQEFIVREIGQNEQGKREIDIEETLPIFKTAK